MRVITLLGDKFTRSCHALYDKVRNDFQPDVIIGVLTGGGFVGQEMSNCWPDVVYTETKIQRNNTTKKEKGIIHKVLQILPYFMLNWLRMAEMLYEDLKAKKSNPKREGKVELPDDVDKLLKEKKQNVLLVDDAIDTGATLKLIHETLSNRYPLATIKIAVITVTSNKPMIDADYYIYHDRTLVRFPWSNDVKHKQ